MNAKTQTDGVLPKIKQPRVIRRRLASGKEIPVGKNPWWHWIFTGITLIAATLGTMFLLFTSPISVMYGGILSIVWFSLLNNAAQINRWVFYYYNFLLFLIALLNFILIQGWIQK